MAQVQVAGGKKKVVIIGGGVGGSRAAKALQFHADVVLIDEKEYYEIPWGNMRSMVEPSFSKRAMIDHREYFTNGRLVTSPAVKITESEVLTAKGEHIAYDYLIIATGHKHPFAETRTDKLSQYQKEADKIKSANSILIVGGGATGVELAGEIAMDLPEKKVTLVHRGQRLLDFMSPKASKKTLDWFTSKNVEVILGQSVNLDAASDGYYKTSGGQTIKADCHFLCTGMPLGSSWLKDTFLKNAVDDHGRVMVDEHLMVRGHKNIFAIGDITDLNEIKQGYLAQQHAEVTAKNVKKLIKGVKESKLVTYKAAGSGMAIVSLGRKEAVAQFPFMTMFGRLPGMVKSGDLFVGHTRKEMGLKYEATIE